MRLRRLAPLVPLALGAHPACGPAPERTDPAITLTGLSPATEASPASDIGSSSNGPQRDGLSIKELFPNELFPNGFLPNMLFLDVASLDNLWLESFWQGHPAALALVQEYKQAREFLKYVYECATPPGVSTTIEAQGTTLVFNGLIGVAPQWEKGEGCDQGCQRWVSACVMARMNAFGESITISMRVPDDAPEDVRQALKVGENERNDYTLREGTFYGNLFRRETLSSNPAMPSVPAPRFYACAGPGSNLPDVTRRFCSSQGADTPIDVVGVCYLGPNQSSACDGVSGDEASGAMHDCRGRDESAAVDKQGGEPESYREVITVYLKPPEGSCGNNVCEAAEESTRSCPNDCPAGWAFSFSGVLTEAIDHKWAPNYLTGDRSWVRTSALAPDGSIVLAGVAPPLVIEDPAHPNLDNGASAPSLDAPNAPTLPGTQFGLIAKFAPDGKVSWIRRFGDWLTEDVAPAAVAVGPDGTIGVALSEYEEGDFYARVSTFTADGEPIWTKALDDTLGHNQADALAFDGDGNLLVAGHYDGSFTAGSMTHTDAIQGQAHEFVTKLSPDGDELWMSDRFTFPAMSAQAIAVGPGGDVLVGLHGSMGGALRRLDGEKGELVWSRSGNHGGVAVGPDGSVYAAGAFFGTYDFAAPDSARAGDLFVAKYAESDGAPLQVRVFTPDCVGERVGCGDSYQPTGAPGQLSRNGFEGRDVTFDDSGNVIVSVLGGRPHAKVPFGDQDFVTYATDDAFVIALSPGLDSLVWARQVRMTLDGTMRGAHYDRASQHVVLSGTFSGSMVVNNRLLVSDAPEQPTVGSTFLASFAVP